MSLRLPKSEILHGRKQFRLILTRGIKLTGNSIACHYIVGTGKAENVHQIHAGFSVNSKSFNAVKRNRVKRLMREAYRHTKVLLERALPSGVFVSMVFSIKPGTVILPSYESVQAEIETMLQRIASEVNEGK